MKRRNSIYESPKHPELVDLLKRVRDQIKQDIRVAVPGKVIRYDATLQLADVEVQFLLIRADNEQPAEIIIVHNAPVAFPRTHTGYITFPIQPGDYGQLIVNDRSIDKWLEYGTAVDPTFPHTNNLTDATFYPGMHPKNDPITPPTSTTSTVVEGPTIQFGRNAVRGVSRLGDKVTADISMATWLSAATTKLNALPGPALVGPLDFGVINEASEKVLSE